MKFLQFTKRDLSSKATDLVQFDMESLKQVAMAKTGVAPDLWLTDPDLYEKDGRVLRDSPTPRLLAYSAQTHTLYVTDGCNSCAHELAVDLPTLGAREREDFSKKNNIRPELLETLAASIH